MNFSTGATATLVGIVIGIGGTYRPLHGSIAGLTNDVLGSTAVIRYITINRINRNFPEITAIKSDGTICNYGENIQTDGALLICRDLIEGTEVSVDSLLKLDWSGRDKMSGFRIDELVIKDGKFTYSGKAQLQYRDKVGNEKVITER